jgi:hypothetical protein
MKVGPDWGYAQKVYRSPFAPTSWSRFVEGEAPAWALSSAYSTLWHLYHGSIRELEVNFEEAAKLAGEFEIVINTAPLDLLCDGTHDFGKRQIWVEHEAPSIVPPNSMLYNGSPSYSWYRASDIFGVRSTEYGWREGLGRGYTPGLKVTGTDCDCHPRVHRAGRWGTWTPGILVHHAFETATNAVI